MKRIALALCLVLAACEFVPSRDVVISDTVAATVLVTTPEGRGSGVFITPRGHVLTCAHVISDQNEPIKVQPASGPELLAVVVAIDRVADLALLKVAETLRWRPYVPLARSVRVGEDVFAVGTPIGYFNSVSHGIVSALNRSIPGYKEFTGRVQVDAAINHGSSGGPVVNSKGYLVGLAEGMDTECPAYAFSGIAFIIPVSLIRKFLEPYRGLDITE
jgi:S1-C subfamily serine protease